MRLKAYWTPKVNRSFLGPTSLTSGFAGAGRFFFAAAADVSWHPQGQSAAVGAKGERGRGFVCRVA